MDWVALAVWALVALVAIPLGRGAFAAPSLGLQPPLGIAGLALSVLFAIDGVAGVAWAAFGVAIAGCATAGAGAARLIADEHPAGPAEGRAAEHEAALAGIAVPMYGVAAGVSLLAALAADGTL